MSVLRPSHEHSFMQVAEVLAQRSTCARRKVGAVLVNDYHHIIGTGYNGVARGMDHCHYNYCGGQHYPSGQGLEACLAIHAEQNALMQCHNVMEISAIYVTTSPCMHCLKMLLNTGCKMIYYKTLYDDKSLDLWTSFRGKYAHRVDYDLDPQV